MAGATAAGARVAPDIAIRDAGLADAESVARLLSQLGYPADVASARRRVEEYADSDSARIFVAVLAGQVVGVASFVVMPLLEHDAKSARLTAIVVDERHRREGVGARLVRAVEAEARARGCGWVELTSSERRPEAHAFYRGLGYEEFPKRFLKTLPGHVPKRR